MRKHSPIWLSAAGIVVLLLAACTPKATSTPAPTATRVQPLATVAAPKPVAEDDPWTKVVAAARKEGTVTIYSTVFVADIGRRISQDFKKQFDINVEILSGNGATLKERILLEQSMKTQVGDVFNIGGAGSTSELVIMGRAERIDDLPSVKEKSAFKVDPVYSPGGELLVWLIAYSTVITNSTLVKGDEEPKSYKDILSPRWKGKILVPDPRTTGGSTPFFYVPRFYKALDLEYYRRLAQLDVKEWGGNPREAIRMVARGEFAFYLGGSTDTAAPIIAEGAPVKFPFLEEGATGHLGNVMVAKGAPHPNAARVFVNWLMSKEGQYAYGESSTSTPARKDVPDFIHPKAKIEPLPKLWPRTWEFEEWAIKDQKDKTLEQIFGRR